MFRKIVIVFIIFLSYTNVLANLKQKIACSSNRNDEYEYKYLYNYLTGIGAHNFTETVTIGFLGAYGQSKVVLGALPLAIDAVNNDKDLLPGRKLRYVAADIGTNPASSGLARRKSSLAARAITVMTEMRDNGTIAFIGPDDTCSSEALVAAAWNLPMISYKCSDTKVSDKRVFYTFARTLTPSSKVSKSVVALLIAFKWDRFVVVSGTHPASGSEVKEAIKELSEMHGLIVTDTKQYSDYIPRHIDQMDLIVDDTYKRTRVYVFVGEHIALVDFVKCLQRRKLLDSGDYVVISVDDEIYDPNRRIKIIQRDYLDPFLDETWKNMSDIMGFRSVLKLTPSHPRNPHYKAICEQIKASSRKPPFCVPYHHKIFDSMSVSIQAAYLYDAVMIYARALTEVFKDNEDPRNGTAILQRIINRSFHSIQGYDVFIDENGDAEGNFTVVALLDDQEMNGTLRMSMQPVGYFQYYGSSLRQSLPEFKYLDLDRPIQWVKGKLPRAEPVCGFQREKCIYKTDWRLIASMSLVTIIVFVLVLFGVKHYRYEQKLACLLWKIDMKDVTIIPTETTQATAKNKSMIQVCRHSVFQAPTGSIAEITETNPKRAYTRIGLYKGNIVAIKPLYKRSVDLTRSIRKELKQIREVRHENIIPFIGASVDHANVAILTAYCARGSLEDVLANEDLHLDNMFVSSLVTDILKGMTYLHDSDIISHGNLRSSNCLIDSRWVLQITDFGLYEFRAGQDDPDYEMKALRRSLWQAPELLRDPSPPLRGTQKGDIYSFGILLYEIIGRSGPWGNIDISPADVISAVKEENQIDPFRPNLVELGAAEYITKCIMSCWHEEPEQRPDISFVRVKLKEMQDGLKPNIFDNMLAIMEKYAYNLEGLVQERTNQLTEEKKKTDALVHRMLPKSVAESLKRGDRVEAESFDCVTIYFSDIVGFTELSAVSTPLQVIDLLNDLYTCFDSIISHYDVYKVETIGDAYMVVSGLPIRNGDRHAGEIASMALHLLSKIKKFEIKHRTGELLQLRIGIHSGHCVAGVVGLRMPRYCLFGDTVNTASRMESSGHSFKIHISQATYMLLQRLGGYRCEERGIIPIKGKGEMQTYWLIGEDQAQRMARIREEMLGSSLFSSISSSHFSETPDLLRRPELHLKTSGMNSRGILQSSCPLLHQRARRATSSMNLSQLYTKLSSRNKKAQGAPIMRRAHDEVSRDEHDNSEEEDGYNLRNKRARLECSTNTTDYVSPYICKRIYRKKSPLIYLPNEIIQKVFTYISYEELGNNVRLVNKKFKLLAQELMNSTFKKVERRLSNMKKIIAISISHSQDQMETKCFCKMLNILEFINFHYTILHSTIWRHISNEYRPATKCMYGGSILDLYNTIFQLYTKEPHKIYGTTILNDYSMPNEVDKLSQLTKIFVLYFDRVSEQGINTSVSCTGSKILDILDCATEVKKDILLQVIADNILTYRVSYYFCNSWLVALETKDERSKPWSEQMRLMYMRLRRIVVSHTEMQMEYAQYRRELDLIPSFGTRIKKPVNSVYTGYGEVGEMFYYYGSMNEGAYFNKFSAFATNLLSPGNPEEDILNREGIVPFVGLSINIELKCTLRLAPFTLLRNIHLNIEDHEANSNGKVFELQIDFDCAGASYARLPEKYREDSQAHSHCPYTIATRNHNLSLRPYNPRGPKSAPAVTFQISIND